MAGILRAKDYGDRVFRGEETATVHSVFERGFNLAMADGRLVHVAIDKPAEHSQMVGFGACAGAWLGPEVGSRFQVSESRKLLQGSNLVIDCRHALPLEALALQATCLSQEQLRQIDSSVRTRRQGRDLEHWQVYFTAIEFQVRAFTSTGRVEHLESVVGLGLGLTPTGDDVLVGLLASLKGRGSQHTSDLEDLMRGYADRTTDVSADLLRAAAAGYFPFALVDLANSKPDRGAGEIESLVRRICAIGATSGMDTLLGFMMGMQEVQ